MEKRADRKGLVIFHYMMILLISTGCAQEEARKLPSELLAAQGLSSHVVFIDRAGSKGYLLDVMSKELSPRVQEVELPSNPFWVEQRRGKDELLILSSGRREGEGESGEKAALSIMEDSGKVRSYRIESGFNKLEQSEDGRYVFLYFDRSVSEGGISGKLAGMGQNAVLMDLESPPAEGETVKTVILGNSQGDVPMGVSFSEEIEIEGKLRRLAVIYSKHLIWVKDLTNLELPPITVEPEVGRMFEFSQVLFDREGARIYLLGTNSESIQVVDFTAKTAPIESNEFTPTVRDPRLVGWGPMDMAMYSVGESRYLMVLSEDGYRAELMSTSNSDQVDIRLESPASRIMVYYESEDKSHQHPYALLYDGRGGTGVTFLDLSTVEVSGESWLQSESVETVYLEHSFDEVLRLESSDQVLLKTGGGEGQLSLLDLTNRNIFRIETEEGLRIYPDRELNRLWLSPLYGGERLGYLDLESLMSTEVWLDATIGEVLTFGEAQNRRLVVVHPSSVGYVTVMEVSESLSRSESTSLEGFFISDILDRGE